MNSAIVSVHAVMRGHLSCFISEIRLLFQSKASSGLQHMCSHRWLILENLFLQQYTISSAHVDENFAHLSFWP